MAAAHLYRDTSLNEHRIDTGALTFDKQESFLRGYIPLKNIKDKYTKDGKGKTEINFSKNAYCTDAVLKTISTLPQASLKAVTKIDLTGCYYLSDNSSIWLSKILKATDCYKPTVITDGCKNLTDSFFSTLCEAKPSILSLKSTSVAYLPDIGNAVGCASLAGVSEKETSGDIKQWVKKVTNYSSQYNSSTWAAKTVEGQPTVYPKYGDIHGAWAQGNCNANQWIELQYAEPVFVTEINVYETYHSGAIKRISVFTPGNNLQMVYEVPKVTNIEKSRILNVKVQQLNFKVNQIKIDSDCSVAGSWCEIDAVELVGLKSLKAKAFSGKPTESKQSHLLILPQKSITSSVGAMLVSQKTEKKSINHWRSWNEVPEWSVNVTEVSPDNPFFSHILPSNPTQAVICYDAQSQPEVAKKYVVDTLTRMLFREKNNPKHSKDAVKQVVMSSAESLSLVAHGNFINPCHISNLSYKDGVIRNLSTDEKVIGLCHSEMPLTRSNPYFEVEVVETDTSTKEIAVLIGCLRDILYTERSAMSSSEVYGGEVQGFELTEVGRKFGFGIEGEWLSEYVPKDTAKFYFTENGAKVPKDTEHPPFCGMYPCVSVLGKKHGAVRLNNHVPFPTGMFEPFFTHLCLCTPDGVVTYRDDYLHSGDVGLLIIGPEPVSKTNNTCTIEILDTGAWGAISFGIGPENYALNRQVGWNRNSVALHGDDGKVFHATGSGSSMSQAWKVGDKIMMKVDPQECSNYTTYHVTWYINGKVQNSSPIQMDYTEQNGVRCMFMVGTHSKKERYRVLNMRNKNIIPSSVSSSLTLGRCHFMNVFDDGKIQYRKFFNKTCFGTFLSKTRLNSSMMSFEVEILTASSQKHMGIGLAHWNYPRDKMVGWLPGSIGYHADNGHIYQEYSSGIGDANQFGAKDVIVCGINESGVKFTDEGEIAPGQTVTVYFKKKEKSTDCDLR